MVFELDAFVSACRESLGARNAAEIVRDVAEMLALDARRG